MITIYENTSPNRDLGKHSHFFFINDNMYASIMTLLNTLGTGKMLDDNERPPSISDIVYYDWYVKRHAAGQYIFFLMEPQQETMLYLSGKFNKIK